MATMVDIAGILQVSIPQIRVHKAWCSINRAACELLGVTPGEDRVLIRQDLEQKLQGRDRIYIAKSALPVGFRLIKKDCAGRIYSKRLCSQLAEHLQGPGFYRICSEVKVQDGGITYYEIFFKKSK